jgi:hypothetical protein
MQTQSGIGCGGAHVPGCPDEGCATARSVSTYEPFGGTDGSVPVTVVPSALTARFVSVASPTVTWLVPPRLAPTMTTLEPLAAVAVMVGSCCAADTYGAAMPSKADRTKRAKRER